MTAASCDLNARSTARTASDELSVISTVRRTRTIMSYTYAIRKMNRPRFEEGNQKVSTDADFIVVHVCQ